MATTPPDERTTYILYPQPWEDDTDFCRRMRMMIARLDELAAGACVILHPSTVVGPICIVVLASVTG